MNSRKYWERRAAQDMYDRMGTAESTAAEMNAAIQQTSAYLEKEVRAVLRGMQSFGISEAEAKKILNAAGDGTALQRLRKSAQQVSDPEKREALLNAINSAGAYRYRITRIEELNKDIVKQCRELYKTENQHITSALGNVAEDSYYREIFSIQKGTGLGFSFSKFSQKDVDRILRFRWSGGNYSQRIWKDVNGMTARLKSELLVSMLSGRSNEKTARIFQEQFGVNAFCARRIVRTESAYVANAAQAKAYDEAGIDRYRFVATLDSRTCECCAALDGKVFELTKAKPGTNYPPMHPFCRSTTIADFGDEELAGLERRAKDKDGNTVRVPAGMTYEDWHRKFVDGEKALDKSGESGIIKSGSDSVALEYQRYGRNKTTLVNKTYIDGGEYRRKFDNISDNAVVNKSVYNSAKSALKHRSGTVYEDMYWIDSETGTVIASEINSQTQQKIVYSEATKKVVSSHEKNKIITVHTHPNSMPPSAADFNSCYRNGYKRGYVACHDGKVFAYTSEQEISEELYSLYISSYISEGMSEYEAQIKTLEKLKENHLIDFWEVT